MFFDVKTLKSLSFWITLFAIGSIELTHLAGSLPAKQSSLAIAGAAVAYAIAAAIRKRGTDLKHGFRTTEFWIALLAVGLAAVQSLQGNLHIAVLGSIIAGLTAVINVAHAVAQPSGGAIAAAQDWQG